MYVVGGTKFMDTDRIVHNLTLSWNDCTTFFFFFAKKNDPAETSSRVWNSAHAKRNMFVYVWMAALKEIGPCSQNNTSQTQRPSKNLFSLYTAVQHQETQGCARTWEDQCVSWCSRLKSPTQLDIHIWHTHTHTQTIYWDIGEVLV